MSIVSLDQLQSGLEKAKSYTDSLNSTVVTTVSEALTEMESVKADKTDLDGYATTDYVDEAVSGLATTEYVDEAISNITGSDSGTGLTEDDVNSLIEAYMTTNYDDGEETEY